MSIIPKATSAQLLIDEEIAHLQECIRELKSQRNGLAPIYQLPPEVLGTIFYDVSARRAKTFPVLPYYYFTHVSRLWRSVALNTPNLWQVLPDNNIQWATAMLERSRGADLVVASDLLYSPHFKVLFLKEVLANHASRICELDLSGLNTPTFSTLFENLQHLPLQLQSFKLTCFPNDDGSTTAFPTGILETGTLRTLSLAGCDGPWWSLSLPALRSLTIGHIENRPLFIQFLDMLRGIAALEVLEIYESLPLPHGFIGSIEPIELPHLRSLSLASRSSSDYKEITNILSIIIVPPTATLSFDVLTQRNTIIPDELASPFTTFFCRLGRDSDLSYSELSIYSGESGIYVDAWRARKVSAMADLELLLYKPGSIQDMLRPILSSLPLFNLTTLSLDLVIRFTPDWLEDAFGQLSRLQDITVSGQCATQFIQALMWKPENHHNERHDSAYYSVSFPALRSLWIEDCSFGRRGVCRVEDLEVCLMERYERRAELLKLKLTICCGLRKENVERLRDIVTDVEWDR